jgi:hypothetical protein
MGGIMKESATSGEVFSSVAARLGHSNASLLYVCHRVGINIFDPNYSNLELSDVQVQAITRFVIEEKPVKAGSNKKKKKPSRKPIKNKKKQDEDEPRSLVDMAEYFDVSIEYLRTICDENEIPVTLDQDDLSKNYRRALIGILIATDFNTHTVSEETTTVNPITLTVQKAKTPNVDSPAIRERATHKRISVLARELGATETVLRFIIDSLQIPIFEDRHEKIEVRHEADIAKALTLVDELPGDLNDRGELKLKSVAARFSTSVVALVALCEENAIPTRHKRYVSSHGGLRLATLLNSSGITEKLQASIQEGDVHPEPSEDITTEVSGIEAVNYQGISLARQNFEGFSFQNSMMREVNLSQSTLLYADLSGTNAIDGVFTRAKAAFSNFSGSTLAQARFDHADLSNANFSGADCTNANFTNTNLRTTDFTDANLSGADIRWADFSGAILHNTTWIDGRLVHSLEQAIAK